MIKEKYLRESKDTKMFNARLTDDEKALFKKNAIKYTNGNVSAWVRFSGIYCKPDKKFLSKCK